jgi:hypothetical protein
VSRRLVVGAAVAALLSASALLGAEPEWRAAVVELSDGTALHGEVRMTGGALLIHNVAEGRRESVPLSEMAALENIVERESMEPRWFFREGGVDEKVYTGEHYPVREYLTRIEFGDGSAVEGHVMPRTLYVRNGDVTERVALRRKAEGKIGEVPEDLLYVQSVDFLTPAAGGSGSIDVQLALPESERPVRALAVNREKLFAVAARRGRSAGSLRFSGCTAGTYDLVIATDSAVYVGFSGETDGDAAARAARIAGVQAWVDSLRDFFHEQRVVYAVGDEAGLVALVCKERRGGTTLPAAGLVRRYEVWAVHRPADEWQIRKRMLLLRVATTDPGTPRRKVVVAPDLAGHRLTPEDGTLELEIDLRRPTPQAEPPPPGPSEGGPTDGD